MNLPDHVKIKATDAISSPEAQAWLRWFNRDIKEVSFENLFTKPMALKTSERTSDEVRQLARDAISSADIRDGVRQMECDGQIEVPSTFRPANARMAEKVMRAYDAAESLWTTHKDITRDHFGLEP